MILSVLSYIFFNTYSKKYEEIKRKRNVCTSSLHRQCLDSLAAIFFSVSVFCSPLRVICAHIGSTLFSFFVIGSVFFSSSFILLFDSVVVALVDV